MDQDIERASRHLLMGGKLHLYKRRGSRLWQCSTRLLGKDYRRSTGQESFGNAKDLAENWYWTLKALKRLGLLDMGNIPSPAYRLPKQWNRILMGWRLKRTTGP